MRRATSWTGTERQRRSQGGCSTPSAPLKGHAPKGASRYRIPAKTLVLIRNATKLNSEWRDYETRRELEFERYESRNKPERYYEFRFEGYMIRVRSRDITYRERDRA